MADLRLADFDAVVVCPHCGDETGIDGQALAGSGTVPKQWARCDSCGERFEFSATIDFWTGP